MQAKVVITMLRIKNQTDKSADLYISGDIVDDAEGNWISEWNGNTDGYQFPADLKRQLDALKGKELTLYINSYGGSIPAGMAMAHMIERHDMKTTAIIDGYCCSIATQIFFSANVCKMYKNSWLMIHKPFSICVGNSDEMRKSADILDNIQSGLEILYQKNAQEKITDEEIHKMVDEETWLMGEQAAEKFKIEVLESQKALNCVGSFDKLKAIAKKIPPSLNFISEDKKPPPEQIDWLEVEITLARAKGAVLH